MLRYYIDMLKRCVLLCLLLPSLGFGKEVLDIDVGGYFETSRLARSSDAGSSFSLNSNSGYRAKLSLDKYFTRWWMLHLGGEFAAYSYEASAARIIDDLEPTEFIANGGFKFKFGDFQVFTLYTAKPLPVLIDQAINIHEFNQVDVGLAVVGFRFEAISRYWDLAFEAKGGFATGDVTFENQVLQHDYMVEGTAVIQFGRTNKTLFEVVSLRNVIGKESLYGITATLREDRYKFGSDNYTLSNFHAGVFFKFVF